MTPSRGRELAGRDQDGLRVAEAVRLHVHTRDRDQDADVGRVALRGELADLLDERARGLARSASQSAMVAAGLGFCFQR